MVFTPLLIAGVLWSVLRAFAELAGAALNKQPQKLHFAGWLVVALVCLIGVATCLDRDATLLAVAFTVLALSRDLHALVRAPEPVKEES